MKKNKVYQMFRPRKPNRARRTQRSIVRAVRVRRRKSETRGKAAKNAEANTRPGKEQTYLARRRGALIRLGRAINDSRILQLNMAALGALQLLRPDEIMKLTEEIHELRQVRQFAADDENMQAREANIVERLGRFGIILKR